ncbi:MAG TPA: AAA family ATPase [Methylococcaceae bacterium]|nr:AAA family ATPase [Methylococcaceae bacterium]
MRRRILRRPCDLLPVQSWQEASKDAGKLIGALWALRFALHSPCAGSLLGYADSALEWLRVAGFSVPWTDDLFGDDENELKPKRKRGPHRSWNNVAEPFADNYWHNRRALNALFRETLKRVEKSWSKGKTNEPIWRNTTMLAELLCLGDLQRDLLLFAALAAMSPSFRSFVNEIEYDSTQKAYVELAILLDANPRDVMTALRPDGPLVRMGLLERVDDMADKISDLASLTDRLIGVLDYPYENLSDLMRSFMGEATPGRLSADDFPHLSTELALLRRVLDRAVQQGEKGINLLFYGPPGTGKTEFAKLLAHSAKARLYEVGCRDEDGGSADGGERYVSYSLIQRFLAQRNDALVLFDEVEDVLQPLGASLFGKLFGGKSHEGGGFSKAWVNQQLEDNPVPTLWVCNSIDSVDPAHLRRFLYHVEFRTPPQSVRRRVASKYLESLPVPESVARRLAEYTALSPAQMECAARLLKLNAADNPEENERLVLAAIRNSMAALGQERSMAGHASITPYRLDYLNVDASSPLERMVAALRARPRGSLCLYGPPGTGKTQLAQFIADRLDRPLLAKRASDLLSPWVGVAEKNIAAMFREALDENAVLLLDEADSFLRERAGLHASWEVSQVNELLQQMERFEGLFVCATNLFEHIDQAALRRFTFKIRFDYLQPEQRWRLLAETLGLAADTPPVGVRDALGRLDRLTPGDFANVRKQAAALDETLTADEFLARLETECALKDGGRARRGIGFVHV